MALFARRTHDDFSAEVQAHLDLETDRLVADGMTPEAAHAAALRAFGNVAAARERFYETRRFVWLDQLAQDLRYAWRGMRRSPAFVATAVATLAVGIGLLTIAFTVFNAYVLRPFAVRDPKGLHRIVWHARDAGGQGFRWRDYDELCGRTDLFSAVIGEHTRFVSSTGRPLMAAIVSPNYFDALGPAMAIGRGLGAIDADGTGDAAVLGHQAWMRLFGGDPHALGRAIDVNGRRHTIVGVLGPAFVGLGDVPRDVFVAATHGWTTAPRGRGDTRETEITVRLRDGVTPAQAERALTPFMNAVIDKGDAVRAEVRPQSSPNTFSPELLAALAPVFAAFALVLAASCANVSNLMLARAIARHRELAVRLSIGASRGRIVRQMLTEGLLIALVAGAAGLLLAAYGLRAATLALFSTLPPSVAAIMRVAPMPVDYRVFLFALAAAAATTLVFALLPALQTTRVPPVAALRGHGGADGGSRLRNALVVGQVAVALVLVIVAVTLVRGGAAIGAVDLGFETGGVLSVNVRGDQDDLARPLADALAADPRVALVAVTSGNPLFNQVRTVAARPAERPSAIPTRVTFASPEFFPLLRIPIGRGRAFRGDEARSAARVAIVSDATAQAFWPGADPIGKTIAIERAEGRPVDELPSYGSVVVVGTVRDIVSGMMVAGRDGGHIYLPMTTADAHATAILVRGRTARDLDADAMQEIFRRVVPDPQVYEVLPLDEVRGLQMYPLLAASWLGGLLGAVALALSVSGLYGVLTYALGQRRKEIGIRIALGATARAVVSLVLRQSMRLAAIGALVGGAFTLAALALLNAAIRVQTVSLVSVGPFAAGGLLVAGAAALAAYAPARRAARVDPVETLRDDA